jgi:hypothetical protein
MFSTPASWRLVTHRDRSSSGINFEECGTWRIRGGIEFDLPGAVDPVCIPCRLPIRFSGNTFCVNMYRKNLNLPIYWTDLFSSVIIFTGVCT